MMVIYITKLIGKYLLVSTNSNYLLLVDAFNGKVIHRLVGHLNDNNTPLEGSFTPDAKYVICGSTDGPVHVWEVSTGLEITALNFHIGTRSDNLIETECPKVVMFNPAFAMFASADMNLAFWIPQLV